jgi:hypothetical protein
MSAVCSLSSRRVHINLWWAVLHIWALVGCDGLLCSEVVNMVSAHAAAVLGVICTGAARCGALVAADLAAAVPVLDAAIAC